MKVTYYGHSCFGVEVSGKRLLFDPFISSNPLASTVDVKAIHADYILLSHAHEDHVADAYDIGLRTGATIVSNYEVCMYFNKRSIKNIHPMNTGGSWDAGKFIVKCVNAVHSSSFADGVYGGNPMGFVISTGDVNFYFAGDTALNEDMRFVGDAFPLDFAFLPIGDNFTMGASDAAKAATLLKCNTIIGMHYDTFDLIKIDKEKVNQIFDDSGKALTLMKIGHTLDF
jgi:L-ascorbate metabolism protein UlaG (beta-lactamase superfamily)